MTMALQVGSRTVTTEEVVPLLTSYKLLPLLVFELILDEAIAPYTCTSEEVADAYQKFCQKNRLTGELEIRVWLERNSMTPQQLQEFVTRSVKIEKFKQDTWGLEIESHFKKRKAEFDRVVFSLIQTEDCLAQELYFRIAEQEAEFADLARQYSQGTNAAEGGLIGPVRLSDCPPNIANILATSNPGQLWHPIRVGTKMAIIRLEKYMPAKLDEAMRQQLIHELFSNWLQEQYSRVQVRLPQLALVA